MNQTISPLLSSYLSETWQYVVNETKQVTVIVDFRPMRDTYYSGRYPNLQTLIGFNEFVAVVLSSNDTAQIWTLLDSILDPSLSIDVLTVYDEEINSFSVIVQSYMQEVHKNDSITSYQILKIVDDFAQLRAFIGE